MDSTERKKPDLPAGALGLYPLLGTVPVALLLGALGVGIVLFVVPRYEAVFEETGAPLPRVTTLVLWFSHFLRAWWPACLAGAFGAMLLLLMPYVLLPERRKSLARVYLIGGWLLFACRRSLVMSKLRRFPSS